MKSPSRHDAIIEVQSETSSNASLDEFEDILSDTGASTPRESPRMTLSQALQGNLNEENQLRYPSACLGALILALCPAFYLVPENRLFVLGCLTFSSLPLALLACGVRRGFVIFIALCLSMLLTGGVGGSVYENYKSCLSRFISLSLSANNLKTD